MGSTQSAPDRILWLLTEHGGMMERSKLRASMGLRYARLNPFLEMLVSEGRIEIIDNNVRLL